MIAQQAIRICSVIAVSLGTLLLPGFVRPTSAFASGVPTVCRVLSGPVDKPNHMRGCTRSTTGGSGIGTGTGYRTILIDWKNGGTTTLEIALGPVPKRNPCRVGDQVVALRGVVTSSTGAASAVSGKISATLCLPLSGSRSISLVPGTVWRL